ncbi:signal peptide containing protein having a NDK (nucleoside-diphosphate kinase) domain [Cryptosporidium canis]|uniref:Nucleoside diphosphate kinase n=1 Tax=Cryptosporidium canis TaxID=195482 RepID=A0ABQ8P6U3_9CRYT|nr:signal peptide containing protein having a NDK (nucleoside-diphosphate kinase) domain [Cryptosporidium canis]KAJ1610861.1 signal peptide containing protein having a NDK (nucleoside-diphosphate kinase) domain [Cryptosporidium canis]
MQKRSIIFALFYLICSILVGYSLSENIPIPVNVTETTQDIENNEDSTNEEEQAQVNTTTTETTPQSTNPFTERTLVLLKPEVTHRGLIGEIISRIERKGFKIAAMKFLVASNQQIEAHYSDHAGKPFFESLVSRTSNQPIVAMVLEGLNAISEFRRFMGSTDPKKSDIGTLRAQYGMQTERNLIHASDSVENANLEIFLWFNPDEIYTYDRWVDRYVYYE